MNAGKLPDQQNLSPENSETPFDSLGKENGKEISFEEHLKNAKKALREFFRKKQPGETIQNDNYLLSEHIDESKKKSLKSIIKYCDKDMGITMSNELGNLIEQYVTDPNYQFGVHRSTEIDGNNPKTDWVLQSIMKEGLKVYGDERSGSIRNDAPPSKTVSFCDNLLNAVILTKSSRWGSNGAVLVAIPSEFVNKEGEILPGKENDVYDYDKEGHPAIKPEFILGFAPGGGHHGAHIEFVPKQEILGE